MASCKHFTVVIHARLECAHFHHAGPLFARTLLYKGYNWTIVPPSSGKRISDVEIVTQISERLVGSVPQFIWNTPLEVTLDSTNIHGWPQIAVALMTLQSDGSDAVVGYGRCFCPMKSGHHIVEMSIMRPTFSTTQQQWYGALTGTKPELRDLSFLCSGEDRVMISGESLPGFIRISFNMIVSGLEELGYEV